MERGVISFTPDAQATNPVSGGGVIEAGTYSIARAQGLTPGKYKVSITATEAPTTLAPGEAPGGPPRVKGKSKAVVANPGQYTKEAEIKDGGSTSLDFDLPAKK
jgi:hypothetical protein